MPKILIADDDLDIASIISTILSHVNSLYEIEIALTKLQLYEKITVLELDLIILDAKFGSENGRVICKFLKENFLNIRVILISASVERLQKIDELCADGSIEKPFNLNAIVNIVEDVLAKPPARFQQ